MLNPRLITDALTTAIASIEDLYNAVGGNITAYHYMSGDEDRLAKRVYEMIAPSILVAWEGTLSGNFDGMTIWKHRFGIYYRMGNSSQMDIPVGYEDLWWMTCNLIPSGSPVNLRYMNILPGLDIMDTPSVIHSIDADAADLFRAAIVIPEIGDN